MVRSLFSNLALIVFCLNLSLAGYLSRFRYYDRMFQKVRTEPPSSLRPQEHPRLARKRALVNEGVRRQNTLRFPSSPFSTFSTPFSSHLPFLAEFTKNSKGADRLRRRRPVRFTRWASGTYAENPICLFRGL